MRSEQEMLDLILDTAKNDDRIRAVILNGSRAIPGATGDIFQDFDIIYLVSDVRSFRKDPNWIRCFGELMILQMPDDMGDTPTAEDDPFAYLMQFRDGNRIDLSIFPADKLDQHSKDSRSKLLLDKDGMIGSLPPADDRDYLPKPPSAKEYADSCNEFWWVSPYVAKGLWREEIIYAKSAMDQFVRPEMMKMLTWYIGVKTQFAINPGKFGKHFKDYLEPDLWELLLNTYAGPDPEDNWDALLNMSELFRKTALQVGQHFGYDYPAGDDKRVTAHLRHVKTLPKDAKEIY